MWFLRRFIQFYSFARLFKIGFSVLLYIIKCVLIGCQIDATE